MGPTMDNYYALFNAVVELAADDYTIALCNLHNSSNRYDREKHSDEVKTLEKFFSGDDIAIFTRLDGVILMEELKRRAKKYGYNLKKIRASIL